MRGIDALGFHTKELLGQIVESLLELRDLLLFGSDLLGLGGDLLLFGGDLLGLGGDLLLFGRDCSECLLELSAQGGVFFGECVWVGGGHARTMAKVGPRESPWELSVAGPTAPGLAAVAAPTHAVVDDVKLAGACLPCLPE